MSLDVIGPGFGRTGTMSLKHALEHLGFGPGPIRPDGTRGYVNPAPLPPPPPPPVPIKN